MTNEVVIRTVSEDCLCIFTRAPELGRVKQRLALTLGDAGALAAHEELLRRTLDQTASPGTYRMEVWLTRLDISLPGWLQSGAFELREQGSGDLGQRMQETLAAALATSRRCVLIGSDCPDIDSAYVAAAFKALADADVVFGPAEDGGYGLVGLSRPVPELFAESRWGDEGVLRRALARLQGAGISAALLPEIYDVDELADWQRYERGKRVPQSQ